MSDSESETPKITVEIEENDENEEDVDVTEDEDSDYVPGEDDEIIDEETYQEFLLSLFPSKFLKNKIDSEDSEEKKEKQKHLLNLKIIGKK